eukprot:260675_1
MVRSFPSRNELRCSGISMILGQILWGIAWLLQSFDYDAYTVSSDKEVIELHNIISSDWHRIEIEVSCVCVWLAFPLLLIALSGIHKISMALFEGTAAETLSYVVEKSYILYIGLASVLVPSVSLVSVSYDWSFAETTVTDDVVPSGYYI